MPEEETAKLPQWEVAATPAVEPAAEEPGFELEPEVSEPVTAPVAPPEAKPDSEDATIISPRADLGAPPSSSPMAGGYVPPPVEVAPPPTEVAPPPEEVAPAPKPDATGTTQVVPPTDIQGPGSAFGAPGYLRLSFATGMDTLRDAIGRIECAMAG